MTSLVKLDFAEEKVPKMGAEGFLAPDLYCIIQAANQKREQAIFTADCVGCGLFIEEYEDETFYYLDTDEPKHSIRTRTMGV